MHISFKALMPSQNWTCLTPAFVKKIQNCYFSGIPIGVVTAIAAPASIKVDFEGDGGHAGAALMPSR